MKMKRTFRSLFELFTIFVIASGQKYTLFDCPTGWEEYVDRCYRFMKDPPQDREAAQIQCSYDGATLISINSDGEHNFIVNTLTTIDTGQVKLIWWTSGQRVAPDSAEFYWEGDGTKIESYFYWHNDSIPQDTTKDYIQYYFDGYNWAWILSMGGVREKTSYICEISKEEIYKITDTDRGPDYGLEDTDPETVPRGPHLLTQPEDTVYEPSDVKGYVYLDCYADAYPPATYQWRQERAGQNITIDPTQEERYTLINGRLIIHDPSAEQQDDGRYQCATTNEFGTILSNTVSLSFGYLQDFPKSPRAPVNAISYQWASIECSPPAHYPDILYTWYKNDIYNFIRPELKPYMFISNDGRLYFSEVTTDDVGNYYCLIYKPGQELAEGKVSMPTQLVVTEGSPGIYEPQIGSSFPLIYPNSPKVGDTVRLECWASGSSIEYDLVYSWDKVQLMSDGSLQKLPLPPQAQLSDHNRVVTIPDITNYDAGRYMCNVYRVNGQATNKSVQLSLQADPAFSVELTDQFVDIMSNLVWRCEASGDPAPTYTWLKNGRAFNNQTIPPEDSDRITVTNNVLYINNLDPKDNGMYQCVAENMHSIRYSTGELRVLAFAPNFNKYPLQPNQFATERGNTTLLCQPEAAPYPDYEDILWYKDDAPLNPGEGEGDRVRKMPNGNLFISSVQLSDQGRYRCHVSNEYGEAETFGNLTVLKTTTITTPPMDTSITVNSSTFLHCVASYSPEQDVTYVWYHADILVEFERVYRLGENKFEIWYNPHYKRGTGINNGGLYVMNVQHEYSGYYTCVVESGSGSMERGANLYVLGPPSEPAGVYKDDTTLTTHSVVIEWKAAGDNGSPIISYVIEGFNYWEGFWKILVTNVRVPEDQYGTMRYNVTNLQAYSTYEIRMRAENKLGTSGPSQPTGKFTTVGVAPDRPPDEVGGGGGKVGDLVITWKPLPEWELNGPGFGYRVFIKNAGDKEWDEDSIYIEGNTGRYVYLVGAQNYYLMYEVAVLAFNDYGEGPMSSVVTIRSAMGLPNIIPKNVLAQPLNATACSVHWTPVEDTRENLRGKLGGYRVSYWKECCETEEQAPRVTVEGQADTGRVIGLIPDTPYYFDVMVFNEAGNGPKSQYFIQRTLRQAPIDMPVEVQVERRSSTSIFVSWRGVSTTQAEEPLEGYKVRMWTDGVHLKEGTDYDAERETTLFIDGLRSNVYYKLRVYGYSRGGMGAMSYPALKFMLGSGRQLTASIVMVIINILLAMSSSLIT